MLKKEFCCDKEQADKVWEKADASDLMIGFEPRGEHATAMVMADGVLLSVTAALYQTLGRPLPEGMKPMTDGAKDIALKLVANAMGNAMNNYFDAGFSYIKVKEGEKDVVPNE